ncbi:CD3072 family TudS-related putative desulfidase [Lutispora thermophila]|uniref:Predicted secreted protein n=1 Tax=Lutispora thermophila DSM 19022 TaxID=1122184 RepID=A0A1M6HEE6_9FIRM|nr:CD3072 family TudS-related putative desulfidase [Lutispora thermophila]SHJ20562.1 Predicted secreted protein [Lutispora thermophila DSM 19022]
MERSKKVIFTSHCILNQNTVVPPLARAKGPYRDIVEVIFNNGIGIHQLPCPEYRYLGLKRKPMTKEEYDNEEFRKLCKDISKDIVTVMKEYLDNGYYIIGLIGINGSPTCSIIGDRGILMEELLSSCREANIELNLIDVPTDYHDGENEKGFIDRFKEFISNAC